VDDITPARAIASRDEKSARIVLVGVHFISSLAWRK
jgi:hypothetical protein